MELEVMRAFASRKSDQEIGLPEVEQELARVKSSRKRPAVYSLRKIAAILVTALLLTGLGYAAVRTSFFTQSWEASSSYPQKESAPDPAPTAHTIHKTPPLGEDGRGAVLFKNARLDSVVTCIASHYKLKVRFADESAKEIRMLLQWNKEHPVDEVLELLNGFERIKVRLEADELVIENTIKE